MCVNDVVDAMKVVTDYTTSVGSLAYSNIVQVNTHQTLNGSNISLASSVHNTSHYHSSDTRMALRLVM
jgi:hypothetical protein